MYGEHMEAQPPMGLKGDSEALVNGACTGLSEAERKKYTWVHGGAWRFKRNILLPARQDYWISHLHHCRHRRRHPSLQVV